jgi:hypothetical protein
MATWSLNGSHVYMPFSLLGDGLLCGIILPSRDREHGFVSSDLFSLLVLSQTPGQSVR